MGENIFSHAVPREAIENGTPVEVPPAEPEPGGTSILLNFGRNAEGAPYNSVRVYDSGHIECFDIQPASDIQEIIDSVSDYREINRTPHPGRRAVLGARIPVTLYVNWRKMWSEVYKPYMTWQVFEAKMLNSPEFRKLRAIDEIPVYKHQAQPRGVR